MYPSASTAKLFFGLVLMASLLGCGPVRAQNASWLNKPAPQLSPANNLASSDVLGRSGAASHFRISLMPEIVPGYIPPHFQSAQSFDKYSWSVSASTIEKMESAFSCNDTPFVDQVRFPLATFWNGRVKLVGFESDVTTANFVLGLPGQGSLHTLSAFGNAFIATHTPPSDQLAGIHLTISLRPADTEAGENTGRRGIEYLVRASRGVLPFFGARGDGASLSTR